MTIQSGPRVFQRRLSRTVLAIGLLVTVLGGASAPALANPSTAQSAAVSADCPFTNTLCLFEGTNYSGDRFTVSSPLSPGSCVSLVDHGWGDRARSAINTHSRSAAMFLNDDCVGGPFQVPGNSQLPNFGSFTPESVWVAR